MGTDVRKRPLARNVGKRDAGCYRQSATPTFGNFAPIAAKLSLTTFANSTSVNWQARGASPEDLSQAAQILDNNILTLGFARRFATYKRPNLLLHDPERLLNILDESRASRSTGACRESHPQDAEGQDMIRQWIEFAHRPEVRSRVVFLTDYDVLMAEHLVQGVDVWVNTPRRPWEASGTSGMKVLVNGGLNLSELDGWWAEAYSPEVGWAIGDGREHGDDPSWDATEAESLYAVLEREVIPEFYSRDERGIPRGWVARMRESMARLTPSFRQIAQYGNIPMNTTSSAAAAFRPARRESRFTGSRFGRLAGRTWRNTGRSLRFGSATVQQQGEQYLFQVQVFLDDMKSDAVKVELYAEGARKTLAAIIATMNRGERLPGAGNGLHVSLLLFPRLVRLRTIHRALFRSTRGRSVPLEAPLFCGTTHPPGDDSKRVQEFESEVVRCRMNLQKWISNNRWSSSLIFHMRIGMSS